MVLAPLVVSFLKTLCKSDLGEGAEPTAEILWFIQFFFYFFYTSYEVMDVILVYPDPGYHMPKCKFIIEPGM